MIGGDEWRSRSSFGSTIRRSASTPLQQRPPRYPEVPITVKNSALRNNRLAETATTIRLETFAPLNRECKRDVIDIVQCVPNTKPTTTGSKDDECVYMEMSPQTTSSASGLESIGNMLDATIDELTKQLDEVATGTSQNNDRFQRYVTKSTTTNGVKQNSLEDRNDALEKKENDGFVSYLTTLPPNTSGTSSQSGYGDYDTLPSPVPLFSPVIERHRSASGGVPPCIMKQEASTDGTRSIVQNMTSNTNQCVGESIIIGETDTAEDCGQNAIIRPDPDESSNSSVIENRGENNAGQLVISWDDRRSANNTNTFDASVAIEAGTVASRVNIFDVNPCNDQPGKVPTTPARPVVQRLPSSVALKPISLSSAQTIIRSTPPDVTTSHVTPPSPSASFLPSPPVSWQIQQDFQISSERQRSPFTTTSHLSCAGDSTSRSQCVDMMKFQVDTVKYNRSQSQQQHQLPESDTGRGTKVGQAGQVDVESGAYTPVDLRPNQNPYLDSIGLKLEKLINSIDQQNRNIKSINRILDASRRRDVYETFHPVTEPNEDVYYKKNGMFSSSVQNVHKDTTDGKSTGKVGKVKLLSCIR